MADDLVFDTQFPTTSGERPDQPARSTDRRGKPGPFTFTGTCSYIVGQGRVAIIDPGPDTPEQTRALLDAVRGETVTHILVSHPSRSFARSADSEGENRRGDRRLLSAPGSAAARHRRGERARGERRQGLRARPAAPRGRHRRRTRVAPDGRGDAGAHGEPPRLRPAGGARSFPPIT